MLPLRTRLPAVAAAAVVAVSPTGSGYRTHVNAICRSYTAKFKHYEVDMTAARKKGDVQRYGYDYGVLLGLTLKQGLRVEQEPVPADARAQMAATLKLLHAVDVELRRTIAAAVNGDTATFAVETAKVARIAAPLNDRLDAVGLRDCGSNQQ
jgi:hypothetical protein